MQREDRYIVIKKSDIESAIQSEDLTKQEAWNLKIIARFVGHSRERRGKKPLQCVVVESDWPEYELVWNMIAARVDGSPGQQAKPVKFALSTLDGRIQTSKESVFNSQKEAEKALADLSAALSMKISLQIVPLYTAPALAPGVIDTLKQALSAMEFMGRELTRLDAATPENAERVTPAFDAVRLAIATLHQGGHDK